jgi:hypothetical protein
MGTDLSQANRFIKWAKEKRVGRSLICHFYMAESDKQYYGKTDYAFFNLYSDSRNWLVKGTPKHGISSARKKRSPVPCLNCFEVNEEFYKALGKLQEGTNEKFDLGIILNKRKLKNKFNVIDVSKYPPNPLPPPKECHYYDRARQRVKVLAPFNNCDVVRVEIKPEPKQPPFATIPYQTITALLIRAGTYRQIAKLTKKKRWDNIEIFAAL